MATVENLVHMLAERRFHDVETLTDSIRLRADEIETAVDGYPGTITPTTSAEDLSVVEIDTPKEECWSVNVRLHTAQEGPSDLTMSLTLIQSESLLYDVELDDIHVL